MSGGDQMSMAAASRQRRGSRIFSKMKDLIRRRSSGTAIQIYSAPQVPTTSFQEAKNLSEPISSTQNATAGVEADTPTEQLEDIQEDSTGPAQKTLPLDTEPEAGDDTDLDATAKDLITFIGSGESIEAGEPEDPMPSVNEMKGKIRSARTKAVLEKYGVQYEEGSVDLPNGSRHINKAIRIRLHWECHQCRTAFGSSKLCRICGHQRCQDCPRSPAKRVREIIGDTSAMSEIDQRAADANEDNESLVVPVAFGSGLSDAPAEGEDRTTGASSLPQRDAQSTLERETVNKEGGVDISQIQLFVQQTSRTGISLAIHPNGQQYIRTTCHECGTLFTPLSRNKCLGCGHRRFNTCPQDSVPRESSTQHDTRPVLGRVYRRPRQRIRWFCERCQTMFVSSRTCGGCGHGRCDSCIRSPLKRPPDTDLADRLAPMNFSITAAPQTAVAAAG